MRNHTRDPTGMNILLTLCMKWQSGQPVIGEEAAV